MQPKDAVDGVEFGGLDQLGMRHGDREQRPLQLFLPEGEEINSLGLKSIVSGTITTCLMGAIVGVMT